MINVFFNTQDQEDWSRLSPTGTNKINDCAFFLKKMIYLKIQKLIF